MERKRTTRSSNAPLVGALPAFGTANHPRERGQSKLKQNTEEIKDLKANIEKKQPSKLLVDVFYNKEDIVNWKKRLRLFEKQMDGIQDKLEKMESNEIVESYNNLSVYTSQMMELLIDGEQLRSRDWLENRLVEVEDSIIVFPKLIGALEKQKQLLQLSESQTEELQQNNKLLQQLSKFLHANKDLFLETREISVESFQHYEQMNHVIWNDLKQFLQLIASHQLELYQRISELEEARVDNVGIKEHDKEIEQLIQQHESQLSQLNKKLEQTIDRLSQENEIKLEQQASQFKATLLEMDKDIIVDNTQFDKIELLQQELYDLIEELKNQKLINEKIKTESHRIQERVHEQEKEAVEYQKQLSLLRSQLLKEQNSCKLEIALLRTENELLRQENGCSFKRSKQKGIRTKTGRCMHPNSLKNLKH